MADRNRFGQDSYRHGVSSGPKDVRVRLSCGHCVRMYMRPANEGSKFHCSANEGCGYSLPWMWWENVNSGTRVPNSRFPQDG